MSSPTPIYEQQKIQFPTQPEPTSEQPPNPIDEEGKDIKLYKRFEQNPFARDLSLQIKLKSKSTAISSSRADEVLVLKATNETVSVLDNVLMKKTYVDKATFVKYYVNFVGLMMNLSPSAVKCFIYFTSIIQYNNTEFYFNYNQDFQKIGYKSKGMAICSIKELVRLRLIAFNNKIYTFWINPAVVCNGDRFVLVEQFIKDNTLKEEDIKINIRQQIKNRKNVIESIKEVQINERNLFNQ